MQNIRLISFESFLTFLKDNNEKPYRAEQIYDWLWKHNVSSFEQIKNIPQSLHELLKQNFFIDSVKINTIQISADKTIKVAFELIDKKFIEGVIIPSEKRVTACISSQVGCALGCKFCATGKLGFSRDLTIGEIYDQAFKLSQLSMEQYNIPLTNIVFMGMGEPLLNYNNVTGAIKLLTSQKGMGLSTKRITISTSGIPAQIKQLADDNIKVNLALSLHTAKPEIRKTLLPVANKYSLQNISEALKYYTSKLKLKVTFEYLLLSGVNDSVDDAKALINFCSKFASKVNVIEYNTVESLHFKKSSEVNTALFLKTVYDKKINIKIRKSRGIDIDAACGQLANKQKNDD